MSGWERLLVWGYRALLAFYPSEFRAEFGEEMQDVFAAAVAEARHHGGERAWRLIWRETRDWPGAVWQAHLDIRKGHAMMDSRSNSPAPLTRNEMIVAMALFVLPAVPAAVKFVFGYHTVTSSISSGLTIILIVFTAVVLVLGFRRGVPRWSVPFLGVAVTAIVMLELSWRIWELFYQPVETAIGYHTKTLQVRVLYSTLREGFFWFATFITATILIMLLAIWPRTRRLAQAIRQDWTLLSLMLYSGVVFNLELVFEEYAYDELLKIACWTILAVGAWIYLRSRSPRRRILALLAGVTLVYWISAVGKWYLVPLQSWGAWFHYDYETYCAFEFWRTLAEWGWVILFMLTPALTALLPRIPEAYLAPTQE